MMKDVSPAIRRSLACARATAMKHGSDQAISHIRALRSVASNRTEDTLALGLLESEICYLDAKAKLGLEAFAKHVEPQLGVVEPAIASVVADNKSALQFASADFTET